MFSRVDNLETETTLDCGVRPVISRLPASAASLPMGKSVAGTRRPLDPTWRLVLSLEHLPLGLYVAVGLFRIVASPTARGDALMIDPTSLSAPPHPGDSGMISRCGDRSSGRLTLTMSLANCKSLTLLADSRSGCQPRRRVSTLGLVRIAFIISSGVAADISSDLTARRPVRWKSFR